MIVMMGVPGVGKSVQGQLLSDKIGYNWFSLGGYLRDNADDAMKARLASGELFTDKEVIDIIDSEVGNTIQDKTILDGFPRTIPQAEWLANLHNQKKINIEAVIVLSADEDTLVERLLSRGREDDNTDAIKRRIKEYNDFAVPIISLLKDKGIKIVDINGVGKPEAISANIVKSV